MLQLDQKVDTPLCKGIIPVHSRIIAHCPSGYSQHKGHHSSQIRREQAAPGIQQRTQREVTVSHPEPQPGTLKEDCAPAPTFLY